MCLSWSILRAVWLTIDPDALLGWPPTHRDLSALDLWVLLGNLGVSSDVSGERADVPPCGLRTRRRAVLAFPSLIPYVFSPIAVLGYLLKCPLSVRGIHKQL